MLDVFINIAISTIFFIKELLKIIYEETKKAVALAWPLIVKMYKRALIVIAFAYVAICFILIGIFEKEED
jgi:hypothetical protein